MPKPAVLIVGADKGGVGKTTVSRTLLDYFAAHQIPTRAFDTEAPKGTLKRFYPDASEIVDMNLVPDQMKIFDTLSGSHASVTVIDVRAGLLSPTLQSLRDIGFIEAAKKGQITFGVFHILGHTITSLDENSETAAYLGDAKYFMVKNFINNTHYFQWDEQTCAAYFKKVKDVVEITIPKLNGDPASYSFVLRGYVRHWLGNVWAEYDRIKLTDLVAARAQADSIQQPR